MHSFTYSKACLTTKLDYVTTSATLQHAYRPTLESTICNAAHKQSGYIL